MPTKGTHMKNLHSAAAALVAVAAVSLLSGCSASSEDRATQTAYNFVRAVSGISDANVDDFLCEKGSIAQPEPNANSWEVEVDSTMQVEDGTWEVKMTSTLVSENSRPQYPTVVIVREDGSCVESIE